MWGTSCNTYSFTIISKFEKIFNSQKLKKLLENSRFKQSFSILTLTQDEDALRLFYRGIYIRVTFNSIFVSLIYTFHRIWLNINIIKLFLFFFWLFVYLFWLFVSFSVFSIGYLFSRLLRDCTPRFVHLSDIYHLTKKWLSLISRRTKPKSRLGMNFEPLGKGRPFSSQSDIYQDVTTFQCE